MLFFFFCQHCPTSVRGVQNTQLGITLPEGERPLIKNESLRLPCAAPLPSCQQETGGWGESFLLWTSCPLMMPSSFQNKGLTKGRDSLAAHRASRLGRLTKQGGWTKGLQTYWTSQKEGKHFCASLHSTINVSPKHFFFRQSFLTTRYPDTASFL